MPSMRAKHSFKLMRTIEKSRPIKEATTQASWDQRGSTVLPPVSRPQAIGRRGCAWDTRALPTP